MYWILCPIFFFPEVKSSFFFWSTWQRPLHLSLLYHSFICYAMKKRRQLLTSWAIWLHLRLKWRDWLLIINAFILTIQRRCFRISSVSLKRKGTNFYWYYFWQEKKGKIMKVFWIYLGPRPSVFWMKCRFTKVRNRTEKIIVTSNTKIAIVSRILLVQCVTFVCDKSRRIVTCVCR